jgi:hypothetical protein
MFTIILKQLVHIAQENNLPKFLSTHYNPKLYTQSIHTANHDSKGSNIYQSEILQILHQVGQNVAIRA